LPIRFRRSADSPFAVVSVLDHVSSPDRRPTHKGNLALFAPTLVIQPASRCSSSSTRNGISSVDRIGPSAGFADRAGLNSEWVISEPGARRLPRRGYACRQDWGRYPSITALLSANNSSWQC
jgi:hypothetical protein